MAHTPNPVDSVALEAIGAEDNSTTDSQPDANKTQIPQHDSCDTPVCEVDDNVKHPGTIKQCRCAL